MEPAHLSRPSKRSTEHKADQHWHKSRKLDRDNGSLCEVCEKVDFVALFGATLKRKELCTISHLLGCTSCPFCTYLADLVHQSTSGSSSDDKTRIVLIPKRFPAKEYPRKSGIELCYRLQLSLISRDDDYIRELATIEIGEGQPEAKCGNIRMTRVPMKERFEAGVLIEWLTVNATPVNAAKTSLRLHNLMQKGRMRVLDVRSGAIVPLRAESRYIALSYVWGGMRIDHRTDTEYQGEEVWRIINVEGLPATIRDAINLVRQLGESYLWIDTFCINQGDPADKAELVSNMDAIYRDAYFTIVAAHGEDSNAGIRRLHRHASDAELSIEIEQNGKHLSFLPVRGTYQEALNETVWNTRGWTYQELMLSTVSVIFTPFEVFLTSPKGLERECYVLTMSASRSGGDERQTRRRRTGMEPSTQQYLLRKNDTTKQHPTVKLVKVYINAVQEYTKRRLSYEGDRLDAFSGVLNAFSSRTPFHRRTIGMLIEMVQLESYLSQFQGWEVCENTWRIRKDKPGVQALPSWSWVGWAGPVFWSGKAACSGVTVVDKDNISLDTKDDASGLHEWPYVIRPRSPHPHSPSTAESVVLHLWVPVFRCKLIPSDKRRAWESPPPEGLRTYILEPEINEGYRIEVIGNNPARIMLPETFVEDGDAEAYFEFIGIGEVLSTYDVRKRWDGTLMPFTRCENAELVERSWPTTSETLHLLLLNERCLRYEHIQMI